MNKRYKNPYFWFGLIGVILAAMGISPDMLTSWSAVKDGIIELVSNPYMLFSVILAVTGVFVDPTTKGIRDVRTVKMSTYKKK